jgi:hypothetical protein
MDINIDAKELRWVALHEASHAVMAVLKDLVCWGIFVQGSGFDCMFCTIVTSGQPLGKSDFLHAAAGAAGHLIVFGGYSQPTTNADREVFAEEGAPSWDETVEEARAILTPEREKIETLASLIEETVKSSADGEVKTRMMDGDTRPYRELVSAEKLYSVLGRMPPALVAKWLQAEIAGGQAPGLGS